MSLSRAAVVAAVLCVALWGAKAVAIGVAGGLGKSPAEGPLFFAGFLFLLAAVVCLGLALGAGRTAGRRVVAVAGVLVAVGVAVAAVQALMAGIQPTDPGWAWGEVNLWVIAVAVLGATLVVRRRAERGVPFVAGGHV